MKTSQGDKSSREKYLQYIYNKYDIWNELYVVPTIQRQSFYLDDHEVVVKLPDIVRNNSRVVILGDPGSGKTTLLRFLETQFAKNLLRNPERSVIDDYGNDYGLARLPIFISAVTLTEKMVASPNASFKELVASKVERLSNGDRTIEKTLQAAIENDGALILLDGLDEIADPKRRLSLQQKINEFFVAGHTQTHLIMTSRVVGYGSSPFSNDYSHYVIREMDRFQIEMFVRNFLAHDSDIQKVLKLVEENPAVGRLAASPLMLLMLIQIFVREGNLPSNRAQLYQSAIEVMLRRVEMFRENTYPFVSHKNAVDLFRQLAFWGYENKPNGLMSHDEVVKLLVDFEKTQKDTINASDLLKWILSTGILIEFSPGNYGFAHLSFQEFFVATELLQKDYEIIRFIYQHRSDERWLQPILLAIGFEKMQNPIRATELLCAAIAPVQTGDDVKSAETDTKHDYEKDYKDILDSYRVLAALQHEDKQLREMAVKLHQASRDSVSVMEKKMPKKIFISYSHRDRDFVKKLADDLKKKGVSVWWDQWEINVGDSIVQKIEDGIKTSAFLAVVLSPDSVKSNWVKREVGSATMRQLSEKRSITVLPILVAECEIPILLNEIKYADFRSDYKLGFKDLLRTLL